ncbi:MAG TPA: ABATE domain-containing protein [Acidimicrobiia bacterium]|nr:ABATE domain-containing protein [Acidimicrobiia bacterium]
MNFSHYGDGPVELAVDLVNTLETSGDEIGDLGGLGSFLSRHQDLDTSSLPPARDSDLDRIRALRSKLREVFEAPDEPTAAALLNDILAEHGAVARLSVHSGEPHLHFEPVGESVTSWLGAVSAMGLAGVVVDHGIERFGVCHASNCRDVFVDTTRNRSRLHCCGTCSTREAVAAYRKRQSE